MTGTDATGSDLVADPPLLVTDGPADVVLAAARAAVAAEGRALDAAGALAVDDSDGSLALRTPDGWIVRLPRSEEDDVIREAAVLARLEGGLPVDTPRDVWTGRRCRLIAYREVPGAAFDAAAYGVADGRRRNRLAASIARFLVVMHSALPAVEATTLGVPTADPDALAARVVGRLGDVPAPLRARATDVVAHFREAWVAEPRPLRHVLLHGGLHAGTMALSEPVGELVGVSGFSRVQLGPPSLDLRYLARVSGDAPPGVCRDLMHRVADQYARTGITLDVDGARAAMAMTDLATAIASGDFRRFTPDDGVWAWPGADRG